MNIDKINTTIIALLSVTVFLTGCSDEQKEPAKQTNPSISELKPVVPTDKKVEEAPTIIDESTEVVDDSIIDKVDDLMEATESITSNTEIAPAEVVSDATEEVKATPELITKTQQALFDLGFNPGAIDGVMGPKTMAAMEKFQQQQKLPVGKMTNETLQALFE